MKRSYFVGLAILFCGNFLLAQDFDGDSIYYTPIPKPAQRTVTGKSSHRVHSSTTLVSRKPEYFFNFQTGPLIGCGDCENGKDISFTTSIVNGITIEKKIRAGLGIGLDSYVGWKTMPLFGALSWDLFGSKNRNAFFLQLNYGLAKAWIQKSNQGYGFDKAEGGRMICPQIGYRVKYHDLRISVSMGVKMQRTYSYYKYPNWILVNGEYQQSIYSTTIKQDLNRLMFTMAVGWK